YPDEVYFTSGGTESNNIAVFGAAEALKRRGNKIVTTSIEHPSVAEPISRLEKQGFEVVRIPVGIDGKIKEEDIFREVNKNTVLISIMLVNNEVGSIQPIKAARLAVKRAGCGALIHCDAVQAFSKISICPDDLGVDLLTVSSHKVHGPKGVGALYVRKGVRLVSPIYGGGQEEGIRSGTSPMPAIAGFGAAVAEFPDYESTIVRMSAMRDNFISNVVQIPGVVVNSPKDALPFIINISVVGIPSEVMRNELSSRGIYISSGSACSKGHRSRVLTAMELPNERIDSALRITLSRYTTSDELNMLLKGIAYARQNIRYS
ncbi:MAG: cysteine desulfurase family protein, partial [Oscillospiraceae bacterium]